MHEFTSIVNTKNPTSVVYLQTLAAETYINKLQSSNISITAVNAPMPRTNDQLQINNTISSFFAALIFPLALGFKFASIIAFIVKEREDKSKHQQIVSGMNVQAYWFGNFFYDFVLYLLLAGFSVGCCLLLDIQGFIGESLMATILGFVLYGLTYIPFTYIASYFFKDYGNAQAVYYFFTFVSGGLLPILILILRFLAGTAGNVGKILSWFLRLIPSYSFGEILINLGSRNLLSIIELEAGEKY